MTEFNDPSSSADAAVHRWLISYYRKNGGNEHLRACPELALSNVEGDDGSYGCDTGCEYARLEAEASCPHGERDASFSYGEFGDLAGILEAVMHDEGESSGSSSGEAS